MHHQKILSSINNKILPHKREMFLILRTGNFVPYERCYQNTGKITENQCVWEEIRILTVKRVEIQAGGGREQLSVGARDLVKDSRTQISTTSYYSKEVIGKTYTRFVGDVYKMKIVGFNHSVRNIILTGDWELESVVTK